MEDRVRSIADGVKPGEYGRRQAFEVQKALREKGPVTVPREFVLMDRAAIGLGGVFLHLRAELNFHRLFEAAMEKFSVEGVAERQAAALKRAAVSIPAGSISDPPSRGLGTWRVGLRSFRFMGRRGSRWVPAAAIPLGLPLRCIQWRGLMLVRLGCCLVVVAVSIFAPRVAHADCAEEISKLMSKDTES